MSYRCEDFPCCGHYDGPLSHGASFCREATMSRAEREEEREQREIEDRQRALDRKIAARIAYEKAPVEHKECTCNVHEHNDDGKFDDYRDGYSGYCALCVDCSCVNCDNTPCRECLEEADYQEHCERDFDMNGPEGY